jgi:hypothetical protein
VPELVTTSTCSANCSQKKFARALTHCASSVGRSYDVRAVLLRRRGRLNELKSR